MIGGCASTKVSDTTVSAAPPGAPTMIYVADFDLGAATIKEDPGTLTGRHRLIHFGDRNPADELERLANLLEDTLVADLKKKDIPAERLAPGERPATGWIVTGQFLEVKEGNRLQKAILGFGLGTSETKLAVNVADASLPPGEDLLDFNLGSQGGKGPGGAAATVVTHTPYGMAAKFVLGGKSSDKDVKRAAGEIADQLQRLVSRSAVSDR